MTITAEQLARLRAAASASAVAPTPWSVKVTVDGFVNLLDANGWWVADFGCGSPEIGEFVAAASPDVVLALLDRIAELEANAVRMREYRFALEDIETDGAGNPIIDALRQVGSKERGE